MATIETNPQLGAQIKADAKEFVLHSWSVQDAIDPIPVAGAEGRYFWDYDGKRYLDFASQLVNVSIGYGHPKVDRRDQGAGREAGDDRAADGDASRARRSGACSPR